MKSYISSWLSHISINILNSTRAWKLKCHAIYKISVWFELACRVKTQSTKNWIWGSWECFKKDASIFFSYTFACISKCVILNTKLTYWLCCLLTALIRNCIIHTPISDIRADSRFVPSQWETALLCNDVSHWLGIILESALWYVWSKQMWKQSINHWDKMADNFLTTFSNAFSWMKMYILSKISLKFVPNGPINNIGTLVQIMAWHRSGDKPLSESMLVSLLMHICVTRPQWVNYAEFILGNIKLCWHLQSFPNTAITWRIEVLPCGRQPLIHQDHVCWWIGNARSQGISSHSLSLALLECSSFSTRRNEIEAERCIYASVN